MCAAMIINTIKKLQVDGFAIAASMNQSHSFSLFNPIPRIPNSATFPWGMVEVFSAYGISSNWQSFTSFAQLSDLLVAKNMIIVLTANYQPLSAHYRILVSIDQDHLGFVDPAFPQENIQYQPVDTFIASWHKALDTIIKIPDQ